MIMNENIDLTKILEGCPKGTKLYSSCIGSVEFMSIVDDLIYVETKYGNFELFNFKGIYGHYDGECTLFPSKDQRDWSKFERFWDKPKIERFDINTFQPFDKVLVRDFLSDNWMADFFEKFEESNDAYYNVTCVTSRWEQCIPYNEETKHLLGTREDCPEYYKWWDK